MIRTADRKGNVVEEAIFCAVRVQDGDAVQAWREHDALLSYLRQLDARHPAAGNSACIHCSGKAFGFRDLGSSSEAFYLDEPSGYGGL